MTIVRQTRTGRPQRVLLIGWDAADWQLINPLIERGLMPTTAALMQRGAWGNLATLRPILSPLLWNTVATGKRAPEHGVLGFLEADAEGTGVRPSSSTSRKCKALWNILTQCGLRTNVVGWYASHPAEPIAGAMVSNQFENSHLQGGATAPTPAGSVHPPELAGELAEMRVHPHEIDATAVLPFIPNAAELIQQPDNRVGKLRHLISQTATIHAVATHLMAATEWDLTAIYYEGIDRCGHEFMHCHPPQMQHTTDAEFAAYQHCMTGIYRFHDMLLQTLLTLAGDDTAVILMSDHGYYNDHLRPDPREGKSGPVEWHRPFGILAAQGPGIRQGARAYGASLLEIAPTVLELLGLPPALDMPGRVLAEILEDTTLLPRIDSWEEIEGDCGRHPPETRVDPAEAAAMLQQLADLGYIEAPNDDGEHSVASTVASNQATLAQALIDAQRFREAIDVLQQIEATDETAVPLKFLTANCLIALGEKTQARELLESLAAAHASAPRLHMMLGALEFA
ncbi:MAG: alkaline phosphatase family protein, partial [Planctomycetales bacterium]|nr:alkaline phosphatase family protein [Planctomycetales bacterium]